MISEPRMMTVYINGKPEQRPVDCVEKQPGGRWQEVPVLFEGETIQRAMSGEVHIFNHERK